MLPNQDSGVRSRMEAIVNITTDIEAARTYEIAQELAMTPEQRLEGARELQERIFGTTVPDVRESRKVVIRVRDAKTLLL